MANVRPCPWYDVSLLDLVQLAAPADWPAGGTRGAATAAQFSYRMKLGRETIRLDPVEYRILRFLAARPYHAYTRRRIADAATTDQHPVMEDAVDHHIARLRDQLGFFWNYIQTVPHIGYRFKA